MKSKLILTCLALVFLTACGGGGGGGVTSPSTTDVTVLKVFGDGSGIARATIVEGGTTLVANVIVPDVQNYSPDGSAAVDISGTTYANSNQYGDFYTGTATVNGVIIDVIAYEDNSGNLGAAYAGGPSANAAFVMGTEVSNIPSGAYIYNGTNVIGLRDGTYFEDGTFSMNVNFTGRTASLSGSTDTTTIGGTGISINTSNGTFAGSNLTLNLNGNVTTASIYGNFHGNGATGVTGLYADNATFPVVAGAIIGTR